MDRPTATDVSTPDPGQQGQDHPTYEPPRVITYRGDDLLAAMGPALACSFSHSVLVCGAPPYAPPNFDG